jgi:hypothetical protein
VIRVSEFLVRLMCTCFGPETSYFKSRLGCIQIALESGWLGILIN